MTILASPVVTPVTWLEYPSLLTVDEAIYLSGFDRHTLRALIDDDAVDLYEIDGETYIDKDSLERFRETFAEILHWRD